MKGLDNMGWLWQEITPVDRYTAACNGLLYDYDRKVLTMLYQPLIGPVAFSLYMTLWAQIEENRLWSGESSHHELMDFMGLNLTAVYQARLKLEGIGLLKTFVRKGEDSRTFIYELQPPLSPAEFFQDGMLSVYLYRKIGKSQYLKLKKFFSDRSVQFLHGYSEVTKKFEDIYESAVPSDIEYSPSLAADLGEIAGQDFIGRHEADRIQVGPEHFDFDLLMAGLSESLVPKRLITRKVREAISNLSYLYGIDALQMKNLLISAVDEENDEINIEKLRKAARDWYQMENYDRLPMLVDKIQPPIYQEAPDKPNTKEERIIHYLENTSPRQLLTDFQGGGEASAADLKIIEDVMFTQRLLPGVINVLIHYVLNQSDMKLSKAYVDTIASHWARKGVKTVREAVGLLKNEGGKFSEPAGGKKGRPASSRSAKPVRTELIPDWFNEPDYSAAGKKEHDLEKSADEKKQEIEEILKKFRN